MSLSPGKEHSEILTDFLSACAKWVLGLGSVATAVATGFLVYLCFRVSGGGTQINATDALHNVDTFQKVLMAGILGVGVGSTYLFWGEEILGVVQLLFAAALWFTPLYIPMLMSGSPNEVAGRSLDALQKSGALFGALALIVLIADITVRVRSRVKHGVKTEQLRYGKGVKEDVDRQNVFLGKCWQLPFCRKFVRERCPIYHSGRTCWRERTGCMCEEEVIRNAMENKPIPKDALLAYNMIPRNHRLNDVQKAERCRNCVIYNEHQRHKYKVMLPGTVLGFLLIYGLLHGPLIQATRLLVSACDKVVQAGTLGGVRMETPQPFVEFLLVVFMLVTLSYSLKILEFLIFKLKV